MDEYNFTKVITANFLADSFVNLYFHTFDKKRFLLSRLYLDTAVLVWNGSGVSGNDNIQKFFFELPRTNHFVQTYHAQPTMASVSAYAENVLIYVIGSVEFPNEMPIPFIHNFVLTCQNGKWKIVNACFKFQ